MPKLPSYLHQDNDGNWRFTRFVPAKYQAVIGCKHWFEPLGTEDERKARDLVLPHINVRTNCWTR